MKNTSLFLLFLSLLVQSCVWDTDELYENPVKAVVVPEISVVTLDLTEDTVFLYYDRSITFQYRSSDQAIQLVRFSMDGVGMDSVAGDSGVFELKMSLGVGLHSLKMEMYTYSGSGSLADQLGGESIYFTKRWVVSVLSNTNRPLTYKYSNGFLNLVGVEYKGTNLKEYVLAKENEYRSLKTIARGPKPILPDSCFLGEGGYYYMQVLTTDGRLMEIGRLWVPADPILPKQELAPGNKLVMRWNKPKYYNSIRRFLTYHNNEIQAELTSMEDTVYPLKFVFGQTGTFRLNATSKYKNINVNVGEYTYDYTANYNVGTSYNNYNYNNITPTQVSADEFVYISNYVTFGRYSLTTKALTRSLNYPYGRSTVSYVTVSSTGKTMCAMINNEYAVINLETMTVLAHRSLAAELVTSSLLCPVSDAATVLVAKPSGGCSVIDMVTGNTLCSISGANVKGLKISADGSYLLVQSDLIRLYHLVNGTLEIVSSWTASPTGNPFCDFDPTDPSRYIYWDRTTLSVYKNQDGSLQQSYPLSGSYFQSIDRFTNEMLIYSSNHMKVYDYHSGSLLYDIPYALNEYNTLYNCILVNGNIVGKSGIYYTFR